MIAGIAGRRGQPLMMLALVLTCWIGGRALTWESPFVLPAAVFETLADKGPAGRTNAARTPEPVAPRWAVAPTLPAGTADRPADAVRSHRSGPWTADRASPSARPVTGTVMAGHQLLWLAAMGRLPVPADVATVLHRGAAPDPPWARPAPDPAPAGGAGTKRWSFDSWLLLRTGATGTGTVRAGAGPGLYGASQAGAVVRYRLDPGNAHRPAAHLRATRAFAAGADSELGAGLSARPLPPVPVAIHAEVRLARSEDGAAVDFRPAVFAVTELPPARLAHRLRGQAYAQVGYVGGDFATAFVDGQARVERELARFDLGTVHAGAGAWGGAQKGAARLDVGPGARFEIAAGPTPARLAVDYRIRVAGQSAPGSGIAVTLSTGF